jgi:hypothetical protein
MPLQSLKIGNYDLLDSGTMLTIKNQPVRFQIAETFILIFNFRENKDRPETYQENRSIDASTIEYDLYNLSAINGFGFTTLWMIGTYQKRKVYFNYRAFYSGNPELAPILTYTFYLGEEVTDVK